MRYRPKVHTSARQGGVPVAPGVAREPGKPGVWRRWDRRDDGLDGGGSWIGARDPERMVPGETIGGRAHDHEHGARVLAPPRGRSRSGTRRTWTVHVSHPGPHAGCRPSPNPGFTPAPPGPTRGYGNAALTGWECESVKGRLSGRPLPAPTIPPDPAAPVH
jgi:hypothetical protein